MPAFLAHVGCGLQAKDVYDQTADSESLLYQSLSAYPGVYHVGLAGPDIFFYSLPEQLAPGLKLGRAMHKYRTGQFLHKLYREAVNLTGEDQRIALAYFTGFLGHYCLDCAAHPLVYRVCAHPSEMVALGKHFRYEAAMDAYMAKQIWHKDIRDMHETDLCRTTSHEKSVIARVLNMTIRKVYPDAKTPLSTLRFTLLLHEHRIITSLLTDITGFREWVYLALEKRILGYPLMSPLFINANSYGLKQTDFDRFMIRFERGEKMLEQYLMLLDNCLTGSLDETAFFKAVGSRSYHTGKTADGRTTEIDWT